MDLTRRDALAALVTAGVLGGGTAASLARDGYGSGDSAEAGNSVEPGGDVAPVVEALVATADVVYPGAVENVDSFVETYATAKLDARPEYRDGAIDELPVLDAESRLSFDASFADLVSGDRDVVLRRVGADVADPVPDGTAAERVRYYYVNEVLFALYTSPAGGELVGIENPQGHPGGTGSYQRRPPR